MFGLISLNLNFFKFLRTVNILMNVKNTESYEVKLYIGSKEGYKGRSYTEEELIKSIGDYQGGCEAECKIPVRVTPTRFVYCDYQEKGWEISGILYPRFPKTKENIDKFMSGLAEFLMKTYKQNRISVIFPDRITLFESDDAEQKH